jgi:hypothetical protein
MNCVTVARTLRLAVLAFAFGVMASTASAQPQKQPTPAQIKLAHEIIDVSGAGHAFDPILPSIFQQTFTTFIRQNPDLQKPLAEVMKALQPEFQKRQPEAIEIMARAYASHFTEPELKEVLAFYKTATGKKLVVELPKVLQESFVEAKQWGIKISEQVTARLREEMKKKGYTI